MSDGFTRLITHFFRWLFVLLRKPSGKPLSSEQFPPYFHYSYSVSIHCSWSLLDEFARVCPSFSFDEHSVDFVRSRIEFRPCNPGIRITPSSSDRCKFVGIAENERELQVPAASVSREWSCSSSTMVDRALDAPNDLFFAQNEMESGYTAVKWTEHIFVLSS